MSDPTQPTPAAPEHAFQVVSKTFANDARTSWSQAASGDLTAAEAHAWIDVQSAAVADLGLREILPAADQLRADLVHDQAPVVAAPVASAPQPIEPADLAGPWLPPGT